LGSRYVDDQDEREESKFVMTGSRALRGDGVVAE
jgi:hypothetical protein